MGVFRRSVAALAIGVSFVLCACAGTEPGDSTERLSRYGLSIELPPGWHGRVYENDTGLRVLLSANGGLAPDDDEGRKTRQRLGEAGIVLAIAYWPDWPPPGEGGALKAATLPLSVGRSDFGGFEGLTDATAVRSVTIDGHLLQVMVHLGTTAPSDEALAEANAVLASLRIR